MDYKALATYILISLDYDSYWLSNWLTCRLETNILFCFCLSHLDTQERFICKFS